MPSSPPKARPNYLWLTRFFPYPTHAGDRIYSAKLIESLAAQPCRVSVFCTYQGKDAPVPPDGPARGADWVLCRDNSRHRLWLYPFSYLPQHALRLSGPDPRRSLWPLLIQQPWDAVLIDYVSMGWTLPLLAEATRVTGHRPTLAYVAHNHEASLRRLAVNHSMALAPLRLAQWIDGGRIAALERQLLAEADLVTTISPTGDRAHFQADAPNQTFLSLVPGYDGPRLAQRTLTAETPRRVVVVGSFDWIVKQQNLVEFLEAAAAPLAHDGIGIDIVGAGPAAVLDHWRHRFPNVAIHGRVEAVEPYLAGARMSIVPERVGGGFKLKVLNAVFQRCPLFALAGSLAEVPLIDGKSVCFFRDFPSLVDGIRQNIDNLDQLNTLQTAAFDACREGFQWHDQGQSLHQTLFSLSKLHREDVR
ncbi:glycosyltransferase [Elstera cyanobacteriorum]|uniref:glycosyltransferase n=1 Tax=Elstera cyanobacteriorum TaxID=2022747 RepID=UPI00235775FB|nr:glycosyltransferase [Elstera cyanobacteriorum]MCK6442436.1 glycosyltransferase [Elstera cyanobacteriorum]